MTIDDLEQATAQSPQPMQRSGMWTTLFESPSPITAIAFTGQTFSHFSHATHVWVVKRGMKWGGAMLPGMLNWVTALSAPQQQPQQEHDPLSRLLFPTLNIQVTMPCDSASALVSRTSFMLACRALPLLTSHLEMSPKAVQTSSFFPQLSPTSCLESLHWQTAMA